MDLHSISEDLSLLLRSENGCQYSDVTDCVLKSIDKNGVKFNVLHLNIRSLTRNLDSLIFLLNDLQQSGVIVHAIGLCETFLFEASKDCIVIDNYTVHSVCRLARGGGGTALLLHNSVKLKKIINTPFIDNFESICAEVYFQNFNILVAEYYRPLNCDDTLFVEALNALLVESHHYKYAFLCTDHNYDLLKIDKHKRTNDCLTLMYDFDFVPLILKPTRITHVSSTLIDNIFVKSPIIQKNWSFVLVDGMSDHYPCLVAYQLKAHSSAIKQNITIEKRKLNDKSILKINQTLLIHDWSSINTLGVD